MAAPSFQVEKIEQVTLRSDELFKQRYLMSPFVWPDDSGGLQILVRAVPKPEENDRITGRIWYGHTHDGGLDFDVDERPLITPGPGREDCLGCEDPTVVTDDASTIVYYTGLDSEMNARMLYAEGKDIHSLSKRGVVFQSGKTEDNTKEASVQRTKDGEWRLFYEFSRDGASLIGLAIGNGPAGLWREHSEPFAPRKDSWDNWHLSTGPLLMDDPDMPIMFYNGATHDAKWRIGWVAFSSDLRQVLYRSEDPLITPPNDFGMPGRDIAFASSLVTDGDLIRLYFSVDDCDMQRATLRRVS